MGLGERPVERCRDTDEAMAAELALNKGDALEDRHKAGNDDDDRPAATPGEDVEAVEQEEDADESNPDGAAKGAEEPELVARGAVVGESCCRCRSSCGRRARRQGR